MEKIIKSTVFRNGTKITTTLIKNAYNNELAYDIKVNVRGKNFYTYCESLTEALIIHRNKITEYNPDFKWPHETKNMYYNNHSPKCCKFVDYLPCADHSLNSLNYLNSVFICKSLNNHFILTWPDLKSSTGRYAALSIKLDGAHEYDRQVKKSILDLVRPDETEYHNYVPDAIKVIDLNDFSVRAISKRVLKP